jgi:hypothetical protein
VIRLEIEGGMQDDVLSVTEELGTAPDAMFVVRLRCSRADDVEAAPAETAKGRDGAQGGCGAADAAR